MQFSSAMRKKQNTLTSTSCDTIFVIHSASVFGSKINWNDLSNFWHRFDFYSFWGTNEETNKWRLFDIRITQWRHINFIDQKCGASTCFGSRKHHIVVVVACTFHATNNWVKEANTNRQSVESGAVEKRFDYQIHFSMHTYTRTHKSGRFKTRMQHIKSGATAASMRQMCH